MWCANIAIERCGHDHTNALGFDWEKGRESRVDCVK